MYSSDLHLTFWPSRGHLFPSVWPSFKIFSWPWFSFNFILISFWSSSYFLFVCLFLSVFLWPYFAFFFYLLLALFDLPFIFRWFFRLRSPSIFLRHPYDPFSHLFNFPIWFPTDFLLTFLWPSLDLPIPSLDLRLDLPSLFISPFLHPSLLTSSWPPSALPLTSYDLPSTPSWPRLDLGQGEERSLISRLCRGCSHASC